MRYILSLFPSSHCCLLELFDIREQEDTKTKENTKISKNFSNKLLTCS